MKSNFASEQILYYQSFYFCEAYNHPKCFVKSRQPVDNRLLFCLIYKNDRSRIDQIHKHDSEGILHEAQYNANLSGTMY